MLVGSSKNAFISGLVDAAIARSYRLFRNITQTEAGSRLQFVDASGATAAALSTMLAPSEASNAGCCNDQGIDVADADRDHDRSDVGAIYRRSRDGSRPQGVHGQSLAARQTTVSLGTEALFRAHECG